MSKCGIAFAFSISNVKMTEYLIRNSSFDIGYSIFFFLMVTRIKRSGL
jgi:hypothetical protein